MQEVKALALSRQQIGLEPRPGNFWVPQVRPKRSKNGGLGPELPGGLAVKDVVLSLRGLGLAQAWGPAKRALRPPRELRAGWRWRQAGTHADKEKSLAMASSRFRKSLGKDSHQRLVLKTIPPDKGPKDTT